MSRKGNLFVISGPSGVGKGTLVSQLRTLVPDIWLSVSATTRKPRPGEVDGVHYFFMDDDAFMEEVAHDGFLEWADVHTAKYGTPKASVLEHMAAGEQVILEIDVQGGFQIKEQIPECHLVFIEPPSKEILLERLRGRGTDSEDVIAARLRIAAMELLQKERYDYAVVNNDLDEEIAELADLINRLAEE